MKVAGDILRKKIVKISTDGNQMICVYVYMSIVSLCRSYNFIGLLSGIECIDKDYLR